MECVNDHVNDHNHQIEIGWVGQYNFGDSYRINRACEIVPLYDHISLSLSVLKPPIPSKVDRVVTLRKVSCSSTF